MHMRKLAIETTHDGADVASVRVLRELLAPRIASAGCARRQEGEGGTAVIEVVSDRSISCRSYHVLSFIHGGRFGYFLETGLLVNARITQYTPLACVHAIDRTTDYQPTASRSPCSVQDGNCAMQTVLMN